MVTIGATEDAAIATLCSRRNPANVAGCFTRASETGRAALGGPPRSRFAKPLAYCSSVLMYRSVTVPTPVTSSQPLSIFSDESWSNVRTE